MGWLTHRWHWFLLFGGLGTQAPVQAQGVIAIDSANQKVFEVIGAAHNLAAKNEIGSQLPPMEAELQKLQMEWLKLQAALAKMPPRINSLSRVLDFQAAIDGYAANLPTVLAPSFYEEFKALRRKVHSTGAQLTQQLFQPKYWVDQLENAQGSFKKVQLEPGPSSSLESIKTETLDLIRQTLGCTQLNLGSCPVPRMPSLLNYATLWPLDHQRFAFWFYARILDDHQQVLKNRHRFNTTTESMASPRIMSRSLQREQILIEEGRKFIRQPRMTDLDSLIARASMPAYFQTTALFKQWSAIEKRAEKSFGLTSYQGEAQLQMKLCSELNSHLLKLLAIDQKLDALKRQLASLLQKFSQTGETVLLQKADAVLESISQELALKQQLGIPSQAETDRLETVSWLKIPERTAGFPAIEGEEASLVYLAFGDQYWVKGMPFSPKDLMPGIKDIRIDGISILDQDQVLSFDDSLVQMQWYDAPLAACAGVKPVSMILELNSRQQQQKHYLVLTR